jgi:drug/metabolite transporter (DMT)-like permease
VISTVAAVGLLFAGIRRVGPTSASILSTTEPVVTVVLAFLVFGESLGAVQLLGGALVLGAAVVLTASARRSPQRDTATLNVGVPAEL